jgi:hypothetical protein
MVFQALVRFGQKLVPVTENRGLGGTGLGASGLLEFTALDLVITHDAFAHIRNRLQPSIARNPIRAGHHAIAASHADRAVVNHRSFRGFLKRAYGTDRNASRFRAMPALLSDMLPFGSVD